MVRATRKLFLSIENQAYGHALCKKANGILIRVSNI